MNALAAWRDAESKMMSSGEVRGASRPAGEASSAEGAKANEKETNMDAYAEMKKEQQKRREEKRKAPLRKIVSVWKDAANRYDWQGVTLECGHTASASSRAFFRARCVECLRSNVELRGAEQAQLDRSPSRMKGSASPSLED